MSSKEDKIELYFLELKHADSDYINKVKQNISYLCRCGHILIKKNPQDKDYFCINCKRYLSEIEVEKQR